MRRSIFPLIAMLVGLCGCASSVDVSPTSASEPIKPFVAIQKGVQPGAQFVLCSQSDCPDRTQKHLPPTGDPRVDSGVAVYFALGRSGLDAAAKATIRRVAQEVLSNAEARVIVRGRTDPSGPSRINYRLALERAEAVKQALISEGVDAERIAAQRAEPCCDGSYPGDRSPNRKLRRADVIIDIETK